ncbi:MAG: M28 family peptidase [Gammaproteobacteria bacterium]
MSNDCSNICQIVRIGLVASAAACVVACAPADDPFDEAGRRAVAAISADAILAHVRVLGADAFGGRGPASEGDRLTQQYLVEQLDALGYRPAAADGGWLQPFNVVGVDATVPETWEFSRGDLRAHFARWDDFVAASGVQADAAVIDDAEVVFVGYGIQAPEYDWDDFKGRDLSGKVLLMLNNDPEWSPDLFEGDRRLYYGRWDYKYESAARQGAVGAIIIHTTPSAGYPWQVVQTSWTGEQFELPAGEEARSQVEAWVTERAAGELVAMAGRDLATLIESARSRDFEPVPLGVTTSLALSNAVNRVQTANVLGILPGSDERLADEVVILTAHHDHLGIGEPDDSGDRIYNGARDNALGVGLVLELARAYGSLPEAPRRSILALFVAAEEQGLLGSQYYAENPTFAPGRIAANMNFDGGNIWGKTRDVTYIGYGKSSLGAVADLVASRQGRVVKPDQLPDRGYYYRSDQFNFAKIGVPATYFDEGQDFVGRPAGWGREQIEAYEAVQYHQPSDEYDDSWNLDGLIQDAELAFWIGLNVANAQEMPTWMPGDEFEAARIAAIEALDYQGAE